MSTGDTGPSKTAKRGKNIARTRDGKRAAQTDIFSPRGQKDGRDNRSCKGGHSARITKTKNKSELVIIRRNHQGT